MSKYTKSTKQVRCISAATSFYKAGDIYQVYRDDKGDEFVKGSDGLYDQINKMSNKFAEYKAKKGENN